MATIACGPSARRVLPVPASAHMYIQDQWQIHTRLTLSLGIRTEQETIPSYNRDLQDVAIKFGFGRQTSSATRRQLRFVWQRQDQDLWQLGPVVRLDQV